MKIYLDDVRPAPDGWKLVYTPEEAIAYILRGNVEEISLDYDLGLDDIRSGYLVLQWIEEQVAYDHRFEPPKIHLHTMNPVGMARMQNGIANIEAMMARRQPCEDCHPFHYEEDT